MIGYFIIIIIIGITVSIITEQMLIRRLKLEEGVTISKGRCILKPGYGELNKSVHVPLQLPVMNSQIDNSLLNFYKPLK